MLVVFNVPLVCEDRRHFFCEIVDNLTDGHVCVLAHDLDVVEYRAVMFHRLSDAVLERFKRYAEFEAVLNEGLAGRVKR